MKKTKTTEPVYELVQRAHDGYWERIVKEVVDIYEYNDEKNKKRKTKIYKWTTVAVYPFIMDLVD